MVGLLMKGKLEFHDGGRHHSNTVAIQIQKYNNNNNKCYNIRPTGRKVQVQLLLKSKAGISCSEVHTVLRMMWGFGIPLVHQSPHLTTGSSWSS